MAHKTTIMDIEVDAGDEVNLVKDIRVRSMYVTNLGK